jgi:hypothetical protein
MAGLRSGSQRPIRQPLTLPQFVRVSCGLYRSGGLYGSARQSRRIAPSTAGRRTTIYRVLFAIIKKPFR